jgi:hypothetical protein
LLEIFISNNHRLHHDLRGDQRRVLVPDPLLRQQDRAALYVEQGRSPRRAHLSVLLAFTILLNSVQPVLSGKPPAEPEELIPVCPWAMLTRHRHFVAAGVAVGSGWQALVAYVNVGTYYFIGVPLGVILGWPLHFGVGVML